MQGTPLNQLPFLESFVARMRFSPISERWVERLHAIAGKYCLLSKINYDVYQKIMNHSRWASRLSSLHAWYNSWWTHMTWVCNKRVKRTKRFVEKCQYRLLRARGRLYWLQEYHKESQLKFGAVTTFSQVVNFCGLCSTLRMPRTPVWYIWLAIQFGGKLQWSCSKIQTSWQCSAIMLGRLRDIMKKNIQWPTFSMIVFPNHVRWGC